MYTTEITIINIMVITATINATIHAVRSMLKANVGSHKVPALVVQHRSTRLTEHVA